MLRHRTLLVCAGLFWLAMSLAANATEPSYDSLRITIRFQEGITEPQRDSILDSFDRIITILDDQFVYDGFVACSLAAGGQYDAFSDSLGQVPGIYLVEPYYVTEGGMPWLVGESYCVGLANGIGVNQLATINAAYGVVVARQPMSNVVVIKNTDSSGFRLWELVTAYDTIPFVRFAQPNYRANIEVCGYKLYDYYHDFQWHTKKVIGSFDSASVWDFAGLTNPVTVAIVDDGIDVHEDLPDARILNGYDFADDDDTALPPPDRAHGMACAGIIAASHSQDSVAQYAASSGMISMDPHVDILPVKIFCDDPWIGCSVPDDSVAAAVMYAWEQGADILSCSWSYLIKPNAPDTDRAVVNWALDSAYEFGRGGLGCPLIFASGNQGNIRAAVSYPARYEKCFAVGAIDENETRYPWSGYGIDWYGSESTYVLDLVAPSGGKGVFDPDDTVHGDVWTLDQMDTLGLNDGDFYKDDDIDWHCGPEGHNNNNYNCLAGGTSMAAPLVSGTAALLLSRDSTLTVEEVYTILRRSAVTDLEYQLWYFPDEEYGWGRVDAFRAVLSISHGNIDNSPDCAIDISDLVCLVDYMFVDGPAPFPSVRLADVNCSGGVIDGADLVYLVDYMMTGGPPPVSPCFEF